MHKKLLIAFVVLITFGSFGIAVAAPYYTFHPTILPQIDNRFDIGTSTQVWRNAYITQLCLSGDCKSAWPAGGAGTPGGTPGQLQYNTNNTGFAAVATTTASCSGSASCTAFTIIGSSPITITASGGAGSFPFTPFTGYNATTTPLAFPGFISSASSTLSYLGSGLTGSFNGNLYSISTSSAVQMSITGLAGTATALATARAINGVNFDGTGPITINAASSTILNDSNNWGGQNNFTNFPTFPVTKGNFLVGSDASTAQATSTINITSTGLIGIGTTTPWSLLSVSGAAAGTANLLAISTSTATFATSSAFMVDKNGNVGIGTSTIAYPSVSLAVTGNTLVKGCLTLSSGSTGPCNLVGTLTVGAGATFGGGVTGITTLAIGGALSGVTTAAMSSTITDTLTALATSTSIGDGLIETNSTAATNALNAQFSPRIRFASNVYKAGVSTATGWIIHSSPHATTTDSYVNTALTFDAFISGTTYLPVFSINTGTSTDGIPYGSVGVGTTTPYGKFSVVGYNLPAGSPLITFGYSTGGGATSTYMTIDAASGKTGIGTTSPYALLSIGGDTVVGAATAGGTMGNLYLPGLGTPAGTLLAADPTGKLIATSSAFTTTWPITLSGSVVGFNGLATSSAISAASGLLYATGVNTLASVATSSPFNWTGLNTFLNASTTQFSAGSNTFFINTAGMIASGVTQPATTTALTLDWSATTPQVEYQIGFSATTITLINATTSVWWGSRKLVWICNPHGTAGAVTWAGVEWIGTAPTQTTTADQCDVYSFDVTRATSTSAYKVAGSGGTGFK